MRFAGPAPFVGRRGRSRPKRIYKIRGRPTGADGRNGKDAQFAVIAGKARPNTKLPRIPTVRVLT